MATDFVYSVHTIDENFTLLRPSIFHHWTLNPFYYYIVLRGYIYYIVYEACPESKCTQFV